MKKEMILHDYIVVAAMIKWAKKNKKKIEVKRLGDEFSGIYWEIKFN